MPSRARTTASVRRLRSLWQSTARGAATSPLARVSSASWGEKYGTSKIDAAIALVEAHNGGPLKGRVPIDFAKLRIPTKNGSLAFERASVADVRAAARAAAKGRARTFESPVVKAIRACVPKDAADVTVHYANGFVTLGHIPARLFPAVLRAIAKADVPTLTRT